MAFLRVKILLSLILCGILFSIPPSVGDTTSGKVFSLGINISEIETDFVCRYVSDTGKFAVWTPYEKIPTHAFFNGRPAFISTRLYVFSEKGFYFYDPSYMSWKLQDSRRFGKTAWTPMTPPKIYVSYGKGVSIFKNNGTLVGDMVIVESGETLSVYDVDFKTGSRDTFLYVGTSKGLYLGTGTDTSRTWERLGTSTDTMTTVLFDSVTGNVCVGGPLGFYLWDGSTIELKRSGQVNDIVLSGGSIYISTPQGLYYSDDEGNTWNSAFNGIFDNLNVSALLALSDTFYVAVEDSGVFRVVSGTPTLLNEGLLPFRKTGGFKFLCLDVEVFATDTPLIYLGTETGPFILQNDSWELFVGWNEDPNNLLGKNVPSFMVDSILVSLVPIFDSAKTFLSIENNLQSNLGFNFPDADGYDGIQIIVYPLYEVTPDPTQGYYPDIQPVYGYFSASFYTDTLVKLKEAITVEPFNYFSLAQYSGDISLQKALLTYLIQKAAFTGIKPSEKNYIITGLSLATGYFLGETSLAEGIRPDTLPPEPPYSHTFKEDPNRALTMLSSTHPTTPEPSEIDREKLALFFIYLYERYGWEAFSSILSDTLHTGISCLDSVLRAYNSSFYEFLKDWVISNLIDDEVNFPPYGYSSLDVQVATVPYSTQQPIIRSQTPYSGLYFEYVPPDTLTHPIRIEAEDGASLIYYKVTYSAQDQVLSVDSLTYDISRNYYSGNAGDKKEVYISISMTSSEFWIGSSMADATPPAPSFVVLQNPGIDNVLDFYVWATEDIYTDIKHDGARMVVYSETQEPDSGISLPVTTLYASGDSIIIYYENTTFLDTGTFNFSVWTQDIVGNDTLTPPNTFSIFQFSSEGGSFVAFGGELIINLPPNAVPGTRMVLINKVSEEELVKSGLIPKGDEWGMSPVYSVGRRGFTLLKPMTLTISHPSLKNKDATIFQYDPVSGWIPLEATINRELGMGRVETSILGLFQVRSGYGTVVEKLFLSLPKGNISKKGVLPIEFGLPTPSFVSLKIYSISGRKVFTLIEDKLSRGIYKMEWNGREENGRLLSQGVYFIRLETQEGDKITKKFVILK